MNIIEWRNAASIGSYPFSESSSLRSRNGWILPPGFLVDAQLRLPFGSLGAFLSGIERDGSGISGTISISTPERSVVLGTFSFTAEQLAGGSAQVLDAGGVSRGMLISGAGAGLVIDSLPHSGATFIVDNGRFETSTTFAYPQPAVRSIDFNGQLLSGRVVLVEGPGIELTREGENIVRVDGIDRDVGTLAQVQDCDRKPAGPPLRTINTIAPSVHGNFGLQCEAYTAPNVSEDLRQVLRITPIANGLEFSIAR